MDSFIESSIIKKSSEDFSSFEIEESFIANPDINNASLTSSVEKSIHESHRNVGETKNDKSRNVSSNELELLQQSLLPFDLKNYRTDSQSNAIVLSSDEDEDNSKTEILSSQAGAEVTDGEVTDGEVTNGEVTDGEVTDGEVTDGEVTDGSSSEQSADEEDLSVTELLSSDDDVTKGEVTDNSIQSSNDEVLGSASELRIRESLNPIAAANTKKLKHKEITKAAYDQHVAKIGEISDKIDQYEGLLKFSSQLPDRGDKLRNLVINLNTELADLKNALKYISIKEPSDLVLDFQNMSINEAELSTEPSFDEDNTNILDKMKQALKTMPKDTDLADQPNLINGNMMPHQRQALAWMIWREEQFPKGGILGDDMGLGKTLTMISLIARHIELRNKNTQVDRNENRKQKNADSGNKGQTLVICPASVIKQWEDEINKFTNYNISVILHHGDKRATSSKELMQHQVVITTYGIVRTEVDKDGVLSQINWERIVLDEAHTIRNSTSKQSLCCCRLQGSIKWALTGTPIQNKHGDIFALLKFLGCSPLDDLRCWKKWTSTEPERRIGYLMKFLLLRRTKDELGKIGQMNSLPEKKIEIIRVQLGDDEMKVYEMVSSFSKILSEKFRRQRDPYQKWFANLSNDENVQKALELFAISGSVSTSHILLVILRLRQICIHPNLIDAMLMKEDIHDFADESTVLDELNELTINGSKDDTSKTSIRKLLQTNPVLDPQRLSSKFESVLNTIQKRVIDRGDKAIVVSQFTSVLKLFEHHLSSREVRFLQLTGSTKISHRQNIVETFNNDSNEQILLLSLTAGGVGLNLCGANHLFFIDPHWNPQLESQAEDRVYRIGQTKPVTIYRFICEGTIEQRIEKLQERKKGVAKNILCGIKLTIDDMMSLI